MYDNIKKEFDNSKVIVQNRKNGIQPAMFIIEDETVYMITINPGMDFVITNEGKVGEKYDENGEWCKN